MNMCWMIFLSIQLDVIAFCHQLVLQLVTMEISDAERWKNCTKWSFLFFFRQLCLLSQVLVDLWKITIKVIICYIKKKNLNAKL